MTTQNKDVNQVLPLLMLGKDKIDLKNLFIYITMIQANCEPTNDQLNRLLPLLLLDDLNSNLKTILLMQTMADGNNALNKEIIEPSLSSDDADDI